jgi:hypothetical protein
MCPEGLSSCTTDTNCTNGDVCAEGCCIPPPPPPGSDAGTPPPGSDAGTCPPNWKPYVTGGTSICTPPPTNGVCPGGYVITIVNNQQYCTPVQIN